MLAEVDLGHRDLRGFVPPGAAAAAAGAHVDPARAARPAPAGMAPRSGSRGAAGAAWRVPTPPLPPRGHSRGPARTGAGPATFARNSNRDVRGITAEQAAGDYRDGGRRATARAPGGAARTPPGRVLPPGGSGGPGRVASPGRRGNPRDTAAAAGFPPTPPTATSSRSGLLIRLSAGSWRTARRCAGGCPRALPRRGPLLRRRPVELPGTPPLRLRRAPLPRLPMLLPAVGPPLSSSRAASWTGRLSPRVPMVSPSPQRRLDPAGGCGGGLPPGPAPFDADAEMGDDGLDAEESAGSQCADEAGGAGGAHTPVWPPADASLAQLEEWLDTLRRLPEDDDILNKQALFSRHIHDLRMPLPAPPAEPLTLVLRAKLSDKRRKQLRRFCRHAG